MHIANGRLKAKKALTDNKVKMLWKTFQKMYHRRCGEENKNTINNLRYIVRKDGIHYYVSATNEQKTSNALVGSIKGALGMSLKQKNFFS